MPKKKIMELRIFTLLFIFLTNYTFSQENRIIPEIDNPELFSKFNTAKIVKLNDFENIFNRRECRKINRIIFKFHQKTQNQIVILTVDSIGSYIDIQKFAIDFGNYYGIGEKEKDNGLVIVISKKLRKIGIATGIGTENIITDDFCQQIISQAIVPYFKNNNYYLGLKNGLVQLIEIWK